MHSISVHSMAVTLSNIIARELNHDNVKRAQISYGLEVILGAIIKFVVFIILFLVFGVLKQSLITMFTIASLRYASGGIHCKTFIGCLIVSATACVSIGFLAKVLIINNYLYYALNFASLLIIMLRAPVDPPEKPIKTKQKRYIVKLISIVILFLLLYISSNVVENDIKNSIILGIYIQVLTLIDWIRIYEYINLLKLKAKEVN
ncbi:accessory gene regulator B family protein [Pelotomaculum isophthalicicum JI]|uniref:Accessory gene regulator B family protein n=1 Tax=Pelotomaculum isophthalicicum JI TaxID=947010 RepID=A0A9X4H366_9FIRM|nr:accessory gene regulator B family protein [Pelotomaculum isophthalicicum]MDF9407803.1 accessory gene regulator B family protein [Pelotomaculum isophthalicicum JI]